MNRDKLVKIIVPIIIVFIIAGIWGIKNIIKPKFISDESNKVIKDFELQTTSIDIELLKKYKLPIIIDFGADTCVPCKEMAPVLQKMNNEMQEKAIIKFVDVNKNRDVSKDFPIQVIPTQIFFTADGKPYVPKEDLGIDFITYRYKDTNEHAFTVHQGGLTEAEFRIILSDMGENND